MRIAIGCALVAATAGAAAGGDPAEELLPPVLVEAAGKPIDTDVGHAAPYVTDWDGDGKRDLLVGQFGGGVLWIFRNGGTDAAPRLEAGVKFRDGRHEGTVPTG